MQYGKCLTACVLLATLTACEKPASHVITIMDDKVFPESITNTKAGDIIIGSLGKGGVYRAPAGTDKATLWLDPAKTGMVVSLGVFAHDESNTLYVCSGAPPVSEGQERQTQYIALRTFDLTTGDAKGTYPIPATGKSICNDIAVGPDGAAYVTDTGGGRILRLAPQGSELVPWLADERIAGVNGIAIGDGVMYVDSVASSKLFSIPMSEGMAGDITELRPSIPLNRPDGMRSIGGNKFLMAENAADTGRVTEVTVNGDQAEVRVLKVDPGVTGVTKVGDIVWIDNAKFPYRGNGPLKDQSPEPFTIYGVPLSTTVK